MKVVATEVTVEVDGHVILEDVSITGESGTVTALVGPNGSGKSTLLRAVYRAVRPSLGAVYIGKNDIWKTTVKTVAKQRAVVTQHQGDGIDFTVREIVTMGRSPHKGYFEADNETDRSIVEKSMRDVHVEEYAERDFSSLSGGERQRVLLARALAQQAPVIILDEPTNHLDVRAQLELLSLLRELGVTVVLAVHDLNHALSHADTVGVLHNGRLVACGKPLDTLTPQLIRQVFGVLAAIVEHPLTGDAHFTMALPE